ncbi:hypothetical protein [Spirosoma sp.]|uniref:hypothetical protein n=1 Tax=Spirosoma sp. TaxID=1899569 RepID=UPI00262B5CC7|nr:hypothetical protein [Spirosoma sp.]MCX6213586.1 hypothetical protein [Spirosoma sp.]
MESLLLTPENNALHLRARDGISSVQINYLVLETGQPFSHYPTLVMTVIDEDNLVLWSNRLQTFYQSQNATEARIEQSFAIWDQLTITLSDTSQQPDRPDYLIRLYYTLNTESIPQ